MQLIKNRTKNIEHNEEIIYSTGNLDYFLTCNPEDSTFYCYGNQKMDLSHFLIPDITSKISAEPGDNLLTSDVFENIIDLFNIESDKTYFILRIIDNSKSFDDVLRETVFLFDDKNECISFNSILVDISLKYKMNYIEFIKN